MIRETISSRRYNNHKHRYNYQQSLNLHEVKTYRLKKEIDNSATVVRDFSIPLSIMDTTNQRFIRKLRS